MNSLRSTEAIKCLSSLCKSFDAPLGVLRNHEEILDGSFRDIDLILLNDNLKDLEVLRRFDRNSNRFIIIHVLSRLGFLQLKILSKEANEVFIIDIWDQLSWKGIPYFINKPSVRKEDLIFESGFYFLEKRKQILIAICKCLTQTGIIKEKYKNQVENICLSNEMIELFGFDYTKLLGKTKLNRLLRLHFATHFLFLLKTIKWFISILTFRLTPKGIFIELVGPDGSGKTSLSEVLIENKNFYADGKYFHGRIKIFPRISTLLGLGNIDEIRSVPNSEYQLAANPIGKKRKFTLFHIIYYCLDALFSRILIFIWRYEDKIIVVDRSPYDIYARPDYSNIHRLLKSIYVKCHPTPSIRFLLTAPANIIHQRKDELSVEEIQYQYEQYTESMSNVEHEIIDTNVGLDKAYLQSIICIKKFHDSL